jgi:hypothetical protein
VRSWPLRPDSAQCRAIRTRFFTGATSTGNTALDRRAASTPTALSTLGRCEWKRSNAAQRTATRVGEVYRRLAGHRKTLHGALANRLFAHGVDIACEKLDYVAWQKNVPRSVRDRAPGMLVETMRRKAESAGGEALYEYNANTTALSQPACAGTARKSRSPNGSTVASAA